MERRKVSFGKYNLHFQDCLLSILFNEHTLVFFRCLTIIDSGVIPRAVISI